MCTVTFVPNEGGAIITSNRDEQSGRASSAPAFYDYNGKRIAFPKEPKAGGTWFAIDQKGNAAVLMNGGFEKHEWNPPYRKSRGLVLLDLFSDNDPNSHWNVTDFGGIEPFTLILYFDGKLEKFVWDGHKKHIVPLNPNDAYIWSSSPLYDAEQRTGRELQFSNFLFQNPPDADGLLAFHQSGPVDGNEGLIIDRGFLRTVSITQARIGDKEISMDHIDLVGGGRHQLLVS